MNSADITQRFRIVAFCVGWLSSLAVSATPANKAALEKYYDKFLPRILVQCTTCHLPSETKNPESLAEFPHNPFGDRLRRLGEELGKDGKKTDLPTRLASVAREDADHDGVDNQTELLLGHQPGAKADKPNRSELARAKERQTEFARYLIAYRWKPFESVLAPIVPKVKNTKWVRNPIDAFVVAEREARGLKAQPEALKNILLRRVYIDLIGLTPTPEEQRAFAEDASPTAYETVVNRLLNDPRYGERWGRHWMDVWRYSDWAGWSGGNQIRDSQPHIWRWRDWIVESLNADKGYDRMMVEMLAADELAPEDTDALRATGFLVRNYKMLSREQWMEDTVKHTSQAFLGVTMGCAKCHDHMFDPLSQAEYYQLRSIFEPHQVRMDRVPGDVDTAKAGLVRVFDTDTNGPTYFFVRGDERRPDTNRIMKPGVPKALRGAREEFKVEVVKLPRFAAHPDERQFVRRDLLAESEKVLTEARGAEAKAATNVTLRADQKEEETLKRVAAEAKHAAQLAVLRTEEIEEQNGKGTEEWKNAALAALGAQRTSKVAEATLALHRTRVSTAESKTKSEAAAQALKTLSVKEGEEKPSEDKLKKAQETVEKTGKELESAQKKLAEAEVTLASARKEAGAEHTTAFKPRDQQRYPETSTGRRLAFAKWLADKNNPLTARVAANHIWLRHFGRGIVPTPADFGGNGRPPSHPQLLDWLAVELMKGDWSMKRLHRLIVTSSTYRMASTPDSDNARRDPDNVYFWRMPSRRMEAEAVRDNILYVAGDLDLATGGPEIDQNLGLTSKRRSIYLRTAAEKEVEFLKIFDGPAVTECYQRHPSVMPQQALALANSELALGQARSLAKKLSVEVPADDQAFLRAAFRRVLARDPRPEEMRLCQEFLEAKTLIPVAASANGGEVPRKDRPKARANLLLVLLNHNDFVTVR